MIVSDCTHTGETVDVESGRLGFCPSHLVEKLPFQAVRCRLWGWGQWGKEAGDKLPSPTVPLLSKPSISFNVS